MNTSFKAIKLAAFFICTLFLTSRAMAHNGAIAYAYPINTIRIDGDLSDWAQMKTKYPISINLSEGKPENAADCSAYFMIGYQPITQSLYIAVEITDDDYIRDTTKNVAWNTQDGLEMDIDARHLPEGSGVTSYIFTKDFKNIYKSIWDPVGKEADWDKAEVIMKRQGNKITYEWRIGLQAQLKPGKTIGLDFQVFDKDATGPFTYIVWGKGGYKFRNPNVLGDVIIMKGPEKLSTITGLVRHNTESKEKLPPQIRLTSTTTPSLWVGIEVDSLGRYAAELPNGSYWASLPMNYLIKEKSITSVGIETPVTVKADAGMKTQAPDIIIVSIPVPDLIPSQGILHSFDASSEKELENFITSYQKYYQIPGVSLALIKDGKVIFHQTYGVKNIITQAKVEEHTLFEAASVTKPVFAYAVQRLMEKGLIDLDKPLYEYLPNKDIEQDERYKKITARHVLTHRTGFPNWRNMNADGKLDIKFEPGTKYGYSGEGFEYLKKVVEKITGKKVEQVLQEEVINPLGLYHFYFSKNDTLEKLLATGHFDNIPSNDGLPEEPGMAYSLHTEANAFTRFMLALLHQEGLKPETYDNMLKVQSEYNIEEGQEKPKYQEYMGISLAVRETPYGLAYGHGGNNGDFRCQFEIYKDFKMGYVLFTNGSGAYPLIEAMPQLLVEGKK